MQMKINKAKTMNSQLLQPKLRRLNNRPRKSTLSNKQKPNKSRGNRLSKRRQMLRPKQRLRMPKHKLRKTNSPK
jgi:hypothetical protein